MVINSTHSLTPELIQSMQEYRLQLAEKRQQEKTPDAWKAVDDLKSAETEEEFTLYEPADPVDQTRDPLDSSLTDQATPMDQLEANLQASRDRAREAAVKANQINHVNQMAETYINASSNQNNYTSSSNINGANVYAEVRDYYRRQDMINAFEKAREPDDLWSYDYQEIRVEV